MIITSLLDTDLYKFTMMQAVLHQFPGAQVEYRFKCRNLGVDLATDASEIREEIRSLCSLHFQDSELAYLRSLRFIKSDFVDFLALFRLNEKYITVTALPNGKIDIAIVGPWLHTILFEIPVLAIVNEVYFRNTQKLPDFQEGRKRLDTKISQLRADGLSDLKIADYGTRRRFSRAWHDEVLHVLVSRLGIALSDVYGMSAFLRDFDLFFCKLFDGARHDSGDPFAWGERMLNHYARNRVDPRTKILIFSDGLTIPRTIALYQQFRSRCQLAFGIGTNLTNDLGFEPLQIVIKMVHCNGQPVAKLSDTPTKNMCKDEKYLAYLRQVFEIETTT